MKKTNCGIMYEYGVFTVVRNLLDKVQKIDAMIQNKKFAQAESEARRLLANPNITDEGGLLAQSLLNEISRRKAESQKGSTRKCDR